MKPTWKLLAFILSDRVASHHINTDHSGTPWTNVSSNGPYSVAGFGESTEPVGSGDSYVGNIGRPYGSNMIEVSSEKAYEYEYVVKFVGPNTTSWNVAIWNKAGPDGKKGGYYGSACHTFSLAPGEVKHVAFAADSQGGWAAADTPSIPTDESGGYASTWGEFDFGSTIHHGWSGFDVSAIQAQNAHLEVQGMRICSIINDYICSSITESGTVDNAYTNSEAEIGGIGGNLAPGPVRLEVDIGFRG